MDNKERQVKRFEVLSLIHQFAAWVNVFEIKGQLKEGIHTSELWDIVLEAQDLDWELKKSLHTLAYKALTASLDIKTAMESLDALLREYESKYPDS